MHFKLVRITINNFLIFTQTQLDCVKQKIAHKILNRYPNIIIILCLINYLVINYKFIRLFPCAKITKKFINIY